MRRNLTAVAGSFVFLATPTLACETVERTRSEMLTYQQDLAARSDSIYLARATPLRGNYESIYRPVALIEGDKPPRSVRQWDSDCTSADDGIVVVFAQRVPATYRLNDSWFWGGWALVAFSPREILDPKVAASLRATSERLRLDK